MIETPWKSVLDRCSEATEAVLVAPYIKVDALLMLLDVLPVATSLECITRWTPLDIQMGASDLECRTIVVSRGGMFRLCNRLHAKYYRFDEQVLVGSANLTASGLSYAQVGNLEILCEPSSSFDQHLFESSLQQHAWEVSDEDFLLWQKCVVPSDPLLSVGDSAVGKSLDDWKPQTRRPEYLWYCYVGSDSQITSLEQRELAQLDLEALSVPKGLSIDEFDGWIQSSLRASPFVETLRRLDKEGEEAVWQAIAQEWSVAKSVAARWASTSHNWLRYFELEAGQLR